MWMMLPQEEPLDLVFATGKTHSVRDFCRLAFDHGGLDYLDYVVLDPKYLRPAEVDTLLGDARLAKATIGWEPEVTFEGLVRMMVDADMVRIAKLAGQRP
jgi:GDPmannose 4,6-dehydratase